MSRNPLLRATAVALLVGTIAGPLGVSGTVHPLDDVACAAGSVIAGTRLVYAAVDDDAADGHCATCHALRTVRWALASAPAPSLNPQPAQIADTVLHGPEPQGPLHPGAGRSPPLRPVFA